ncbi:MAG: YbaK/EbsC family protein [Ruminococcus sp.]|nr:YbaK/EbsC family protein [Candidatus Copronaster equi]
MAIEKAKNYLKQFGIDDRVLEFDVSSATVELAAQAVGVEGKRIAKSLSFKIGEDAILIIAAGDAKVDNKKYKEQFGTKAKMLSFDEVEQLVGHAVGGVCPFGINDSVKTYLDESLKRFETVFPAVGSSNSAIELTPDELEKYAQNFVEWVDVCKAWQDEN